MLLLPTITSRCVHVLLQLVIILSFNLLWSSSTSTQPQVKWGTSKGNYIITADAVTSKIEAGDMFGYPANSTGFRDFGLIHTAPLVGMKALANTKLYYIFGDAATNDFSDEFLFNVRAATSRYVFRYSIHNHHLCSYHARLVSRHSAAHTSYSSDSL
jgi:hypothetical protein